MNEKQTQLKKYKIDVYLVDDHTLFNQGLTEALNRSQTVHVSRCFTTLNDCRAALVERRPDVLLIDISIPERQRAGECHSSKCEATGPSVGNGDTAVFCRWVINEYPKVRVVAVTVHDEYAVIQRMLESGIHGYVLKSAPLEELITAIEQAWKGQRHISPAVENIIRHSSSQAVNSVFFFSATAEETLSILLFVNAPSSA